MSVWRPIETAPKDGTQVLMFLPEQDPEVVAGSFGWTDLPRTHSDFWEGWIYADETLVWWVPEEPEPTHWMPLPAPPADEATSC